MPTRKKEIVMGETGDVGEKQESGVMEINMTVEDMLNKLVSKYNLRMDFKGRAEQMEMLEQVKQEITTYLNKGNLKTEINIEEAEIEEGTMVIEREIKGVFFEETFKVEGWIPAEVLLGVLGGLYWYDQYINEKIERVAEIEGLKARMNRVNTGTEVEMYALSTCPACLEEIPTMVVASLLGKLKVRIKVIDTIPKLIEESMEKKISTVPHIIFKYNGEEKVVQKGQIGLAQIVETLERIMEQEVVN